MRCAIVFHNSLPDDLLLRARSMNDPSEGGLSGYKTPSQAFATIMIQPFSSLGVSPIATWNSQLSNPA